MERKYIYVPNYTIDITKHYKKNPLKNISSIGWWMKRIISSTERHILFIYITLLFTIF